MRMNYSLYIGTDFIDCFVKRKLRRRLVPANTELSGFTQTMSSGVSAPLSTADGVIQISPQSSIMETFPPEVVVIPRKYIEWITSVIWSLGCIVAVSIFFHLPVFRQTKANNNRLKYKF
jgi:beta-lactamase regulating signal transducer with metallopeptidase domain